MPNWLQSVLDRIGNGFVDLLPTLITVGAGFLLISHRQDLERRDRLSEARRSKIRDLISQLLALTDPKIGTGDRVSVEARALEIQMFLNPQIPDESEMESIVGELALHQRGVLNADFVIGLYSTKDGQPLTSEQLRHSFEVMKSRDEQMAILELSRLTLVTFARQWNLKVIPGHQTRVWRQIDETKA